MNDLLTLKIALAQMTTKQLTEYAHKADVSIHTLYKIKLGVSKNPRFNTVEKLIKAL